VSPATLGLSLAALPPIAALVASVVASFVVQSAGPQGVPFVPAPLMLEAPCHGWDRALGACAPGWVTPQEYDILVGGYDI